MQIYFSASITGGRKYLPVCKNIVAYLKDKGHHVFTDHIIEDNILELEEDNTAEEIFLRDINWLQECDAVIAEVSNPSLGVGYEICYALEHNKPTLCVYKKEVMISKMITGNTSKILKIYSYMDNTGLYEQIDKFLDSIS